MRIATFTTTKGNIRVQLHVDEVPSTVANFEKLVGAPWTASDT